MMGIGAMELIIIASIGILILGALGGTVAAIVVLANSSSTGRNDRPPA